MALYESNNSRTQPKRSSTSKYAEVNEAVWDWYTMCRHSNIPLSVSMLQDEAVIIAEKLEIEDFVASNAWLEKFKPQHHICKMTVTGKAGGVTNETINSWNERARELTRRWRAEII